MVIYNETKDFILEPNTELGSSTVEVLAAGSVCIFVQHPWTLVHPSACFNNTFNCDQCGVKVAQSNTHTHHSTGYTGSASHAKLSVFLYQVPRDLLSPLTHSHIFSMKRFFHKKF